jgi:hypothetical protein
MNRMRKSLMNKPRTFFRFMGAKRAKSPGRSFHEPGAHAVWSSAFRRRDVSREWPRKFCDPACVATIPPAKAGTPYRLSLSMNHDLLRGPKWCAKRLECVRLAGALARAKKREQARRTPNADAPLYFLSGSWHQLTSKFLEVFDLHEPRSAAVSASSCGGVPPPAQTPAGRRVNSQARTPALQLSLRDSSEHSDWFPSPFPSPLPSP